MSINGQKQTEVKRSRFPWSTISLSPDYIIAHETPHAEILYWWFCAVASQLITKYKIQISYLICLEGSAGGSWTEFGLEWRSAWGPGPASLWSPESPFCFWSAWAMMLATLSLSTWSGNELDKYNVKWWYFNQRLNWLSLFENLVELWNFHTRWKLNQQICTRGIFKMQKFFSGK